MTIALFFSSLLALGLDRLDDKIRSERDVSEALGARCAGLVPKIVGRARKNARLDLRRRPFAPYTEALRRVAMSVLARLPASAEPGIVALASSLPGEGKSMMTGDLASYLALIGKRVLLVELDFRGSVETTAPGVIDALNGAPLDEAIQKLPNSDADCLRMQAIKDDPLVHVQPMRLRLALQRVGRGYDIVVIDAGALLAAAEAEAVCHAADFVLFAVAWGRTRIDVARNAFQRLDPNISKVVLTKVDLRRHASFRFGDSAEALTRNGRKAQRQAS
jgi:Mrp family chromosome partitioning ATPase